MSFKAMAWASKQKTGNSTRKFILLMLADRSNDSGLCWPSHKTIMEDCEIGSKTTLVNHLKALEESGHIEIIHRSKDGVSLPNHYKLKIGKVVQNMDGGSTNNGPGGSTNNGHKPINKEPINEPIKNKTKVDFSEFEYCPEIKEACEDFEEYIREKGKTHKKTDRAWELFKGKVKELINTYGELIAQDQILKAIENNWKTVYHPKEYNLSNNSRSTITFLPRPAND